MTLAIWPLVVMLWAPSQSPVPSTHGRCTLPDFDGDGVIDNVETLPHSCGTGGCVYRVSLADGTPLGTIDGLCSFELRKRPGKFADVFATWRLGVDHVVTRYRFDGRKYRATRTR
jgi:hypothetical protein